MGEAFLVKGPSKDIELNVSNGFIYRDYVDDYIRSFPYYINHVPAKCYYVDFTFNSVSLDVHIGSSTMEVVFSYSTAHTIIKYSNDSNLTQRIATSTDNQFVLQAEMFITGVFSLNISPKSNLSLGYNATISNGINPCVVAYIL